MACALQWTFQKCSIKWYAPPVGWGGTLDRKGNNRIEFVAHSAFVPVERMPGRLLSDVRWHFGCDALTSLHNRLVPYWQQATSRNHPR